MNRNELIAAVQGVLNTEAEVYKRAVQQANQAQVSAEIAERLLYHALAQPVIAALASQPEYGSGPNLILRQDNGGSGLSPELMAPLLVRRAFRLGASSAVDWLNKILTCERAEALRVMLLWGVACESRIQIAEDLELLPLTALPSSAQKDFAENPLRQMHHLIGGFSGLTTNRATAALIVRFELSRVVVADSEPATSTDPLRFSSRLDEVRLGLTAIGPCAPVEALQWFQFSDPEIQEASMGGFSQTASEIPPLPGHERLILDSDAVVPVIRPYLALEGRVRKRVRTALERLNQSLRRRSTGDKAVELSIALESLLSDDPGENTWKVGFRSAVLSGRTIDQMKYNRGVIAGVYRMRSAVMHQGDVGTTVRVPGQGERPCSDVVREAASVCAAAIRAIIQRGNIPDWPTFELSADLR